MYKKQLTFQKIVCLLAVIAGALVFIYSLGFSTDLYDGLYWASDEKIKVKVETTDAVTGEVSTVTEKIYPYQDVFLGIQDFNHQLTYAGIGIILLVALLYLTQTQARRRYYIGNYISTGLFACGAAAVSCWTYTNIHGSGGYKAQFLTMLESYGENLKDLANNVYKKPYIESTFWYDMQYALAAFLILTAVLLIANLIWKVSLMRAEARLIADNYKK